ncbi:MAG: hypothetical protein V5A62_07280 [Haloarculaceae archaeon]
MSLRYVLGEVRQNGADREWWRKRFLTHVVGRYFQRFPPSGRSRVIDREWDTLLLLDACRYDLFEAALADHPLPGELSMRRSVESGTPGYLAENFAGGTFHDVVYVTANPYVNTELPAGTFHEVVPVWRDGWDEELATVLPETVAEAAREAAVAHPDKRLVVHFNQPHTPFIGEERIDGRGMANLRAKAVGEGRATDARTPFERLGAGELDRETVRRAYRSNLDRVLPVVESLMAEFEGLTAVTSDHGNALGERAWPFPVRVYGHPLGVLVPALLEVPWLVHLNGERRETRAEPPVSAERGRSGDGADGVDEETRARLRDLGYAE